jgi:hypothetical protein
MCDELVREGVVQSLDAVAGGVLKPAAAFCMIVVEVYAHYCVSQSPGCEVELIQPTR